jgi:hypothetical protein
MISVIPYSSEHQPRISRGISAESMGLNTTNSPVISTREGAIQKEKEMGPNLRAETSAINWFNPPNIMMAPRIYIKP